MPLIIPKDIPAYKLLKQSAFIMGKERARSQDIRELEILIINLMPTKIKTENQLFSLLANSPLQVNITLLATKSYVCKNTSKDHLENFYVNFDDIKNKNFDGAIITGAPIEHLRFEEVAYWSELVEIMEYLREHCTSSLYICWGAMASLYHFHHVDKILLDKKLFGVFNHRIINNDLLLSGLDDIIKIPHSRNAHIDEKQIGGELRVLLSGEESGASVLRDSKDVFILGHFEYDKFSLYDEYTRDLNNGIDISSPSGYFGNDNEPIVSWKAGASVIFSNWLNFNVYQDTPFVLN